jgi:hypothetical protein
MIKVLKMKDIMWVVAGLSVLVTTVISVTALDIYSQENTSPSSQPTPPATVRETPDFSKYGKADYDSLRPRDPQEWERRRRINQRYDNAEWVAQNPHPKTGKIGRFTERIPPLTMPTEESSLIVSGRVVGVKAFLSNDKSGVYSEFTVKVDQVLKNNLYVEVEPATLVTIDRAGGVVRYPNGQEVLYEDSTDGLPEAGREYLLFLRAEKKRESYEIVTLYELADTRTIPLDSGRDLQNIERMGKAGFLKAVREKIADEKAWRKVEE